MLAKTQKLNTYNMIILFQKHLEDIQCLMMANWYMLHTCMWKYFLYIIKFLIWLQKKFVWLRNTMRHKRQRFENHGPRFLKKERMDGEIMNSPFQTRNCLLVLELKDHASLSEPRHRTTNHHYLTLYVYN
jgi:hypothetical protein